MRQPITPSDLLAPLGDAVPASVLIEAATPVIEPGWLFDEIYDLFGGWIEPQPHAALLQPVQDALGDCSFTSGGQKLIMIGVPRRTGKSVTFTTGVPCAILAKNPNARVLVDSYRFDVSKKRLAAARRTFELNNDGSPVNAKWAQKYGDDWAPKFKELPWSDEQFVVTHRTDFGLIDASMTASGCDRSQVGGHFEFIVADDLVNDINCVTAEQRKKIYDHIMDLLPILEPNGVLVVIYTRWHPDDAYGRIQKEEKAREKRGEERQWTIIEHSAYNPDGTLFFPRVLSHEFLEKQRIRIGSRKFASQYLLKPISDEDKTFNMELARLVTYRFEQRRDGGIVNVPMWANERLPVLTTLAWDPAGRKWNRRSDFHGFTVVGCDPMNRWWMLEAAAIKAKPTDILDKVCQIIQHYHLRVLSIEDVNQQGTWLEALSRECELRGITPPLFYEYKTSNLSKSTRIELLQPKWERNEIIMMPTMTDLFEQFDNFAPAAQLDHEDIIDSLAQHLEIAIPADPLSTVFERDNPRDPEWLARKRRMAAEAGSTDSFAGRTGSTWETLTDL